MSVCLSLSFLQLGISAMPWVTLSLILKMATIVSIIMAMYVSDIPKMLRSLSDFLF